MSNYTSDLMLMLRLSAGQLSGEEVLQLRQRLQQAPCHLPFVGLARDLLAPRVDLLQTRFGLRQACHAPWGSPF